MNEHQRSLLERSFAVSYFPKKNTLKELALQTGLNEAKIYHWFANKRVAERSRGGGKPLSFCINMLLVHLILIV